MSEMVERVARIVCAKAFNDSSMPWGYTYLYEAVDANWQLYEDVAREIIEAMREPTPQMRALDELSDPWTAMIDEALA